MRGQTTLDFAIGIAIFLGVMLFVFTFVPGILDPFELGGEEEPALSDRIANSLSQGMLGSPETPHILDRYCTVEFFKGNSPSECNFEGGTLPDRFNLSGTQHVNVTLLGNVTGSGKHQLCWNTTESQLGETDDSTCGSNDIDLTMGGEPPAQATTITARRVVTLYGESVTMKVVVW